MWTKRSYPVTRPWVIINNMFGSILQNFNHIKSEPHRRYAILVFVPVSKMRRMLIRRVSSIAMSKKAALERTRRSIREKRRNLMSEDNLRASQRYIRASQRKPGGSVGSGKFDTLQPEQSCYFYKRQFQMHLLDRKLFGFKFHWCLFLRVDESHHYFGQQLDARKACHYLKQWWCSSLVWYSRNHLTVAVRTSTICDGYQM